MRSGHCWGSAGRRWLRRMTRCTAVHGNIQNAAAKTGRASGELGYRQIVTKSGALGRQPDKHTSNDRPEIIKTSDINRIIASAAHDWIAGPTETVIQEALLARVYP